MVQKVYGICEEKNGTQTGELLQTGTDGHQRIWQNAEKTSNSRGRKRPRPKKQRIGGLREKNKNYEKGASEACFKFEMEGLLAQKG